MQRAKKVVSLRSFCIESIADHMDTVWCADYKNNHSAENGRRYSFVEGPMNALDASCIETLMKTLTERKALNKLHLQLLIVPSLKEISFADCPTLITNEIIDLVCARCRGLTKINLEQCKRVSSNAVFKLVQAFHETLVALMLSDIKLTSSTLKAIGQSCKNLIVLSIDSCKVTKKGMEMLIYTGPEQTLTVVGSNIKVLRMMGCSFENDVDFIGDLLTHCSSLRCVTHFDLWRSIAKIYEDNSNPPTLKLTGLRYGMAIDLFGTFRDSPQIVRKLSKCLAHMRHLCVFDVSDMDIELFYLLSGCGRNLKSLRLDWMYPYQFFQYIGVLFPELDTFSVAMSGCGRPIEFFIKVEEAFENYIFANNIAQNISPWRNLKQLSIHYDPSAAVPSHFLLDILKGASSSLKYLKIMFAADPDIDSVISKALDLKYLENLESFKMIESSTFTIQPVWEMLSAPNLKVLSFSGCRKIGLSEFCNIVSYIENNNLQIVIPDDFY